MHEWKQKRLPKASEENYRFKIDGVVKKETAMSYLVDIDGLDVWCPKSIANVGIEPGGNFYAIDLPEWFCKKNGLI